ncbi:MAG: ribbon-helix-helix domain-containing protein [Methylococcaceae bacterium]
MNPLTQRLNFRIDEETFNKFDAKVSASGLTKSEFFRDLVLTNQTQVVAKPPMTEDKKRALYLMNKTSNNINQLAKVANIANQSGQIADDTFNGLLNELEYLSQLMKSVTNNVN